MRTREEQIEDLANAVASVVCTDAEGINLAQEHILEAERRAEQRVRSEIARDSERLDWLQNNSDASFELDQHTRKNYGNIEVRWNETDVAYGRTVREAIDAARESNND